jgi:preprotein translocase SecE subunit
VAKAKARSRVDSSTSSQDTSSNNTSIVKPSSDKLKQGAWAEQYYLVRAEVSKVTWPTREESRKLTIAVTTGTVVIALFLFAVDLLFEIVIAGLISINVVAIVGALVLVAIVSAAFYANNQTI